MSEESQEDSPAGFFPGGSYPSQLRSGPQTGYHGEYRGFYPEGNAGGGKWRPTWSQNKGRPGKGHEGVDIYAPYAPHPQETPVLAVVDGTLNCRPGRIQPGKLGNRAEIFFGTEKKKFSYGHLSRFEGRNRKVKRGDLIGYAGCTGNADTKGECRNCRECNVNSGHVHLQVMRKKDEYFDPLAHCDLKLHTALAEEFEGRDCAAWVNAVSGKGLTEKWTPAPPDAKKTRLELQTKPDWRREGGKRRPLYAPFDQIEFDSTVLLKASQGYYELCRLRFVEASAVVGATAGAAKELKAFLEANLTAASGALRSGASETLREMRARIVPEGGVVIGLGATDEPARVPGWLLRHVSALCQMLWVAAGGPALEHIADNTAGVGLYTLHNQLAEGAAYRRLRTPNPLECGASVGGSAWLSAADAGRQALHLTSIVTPTGGGATRNCWIFSVTFGAGSLMHATVSERMKDPAQGGSQESAEDERAIAAYVDGLYSAAQDIAQVYQLASVNTVLLSNEGGSTVQARRAKILEQLREEIITAADALEACPGKVADDALAGKILKRMAASNAKLFDDLMTESKKPEGTEPMCPSLVTLQARKPERE